MENVVATHTKLKTSFRYGTLLKITIPYVQQTHTNKHARTHTPQTHTGDTRPYLMLCAERNISLHSATEAVWSCPSSLERVCREAMLCCLHDIDRPAHTYTPTATFQSLSPSGCSGPYLPYYGNVPKPVSFGM